MQGIDQPQPTPIITPPLQRHIPSNHTMSDGMNVPRRQSIYKPQDRMRAPVHPYQPDMGHDAQYRGHSEPHMSSSDNKGKAYGRIEPNLDDVMDKLQHIQLNVASKDDVKALTSCFARFEKEASFSPGRSRSVSSVPPGRLETIREDAGHMVK